MWGGVLDSDDMRALDPRDPNYDSEQESTAPAYGSQPGGRLNSYKSAVRCSAVTPHKETRQHSRLPFGASSCECCNAIRASSLCIR